MLAIATIHEWDSEFGQVSLFQRGPEIAHCRVTYIRGASLCTMSAVADMSGPTTLGIDEHFFTRSRGRAEFVTVFTDCNNKRLREVAFGKVKWELIAQLESIPGRENVRNVVIDMSDSYRSFVKDCLHWQ